MKIFKKFLNVFFTFFFVSFAINIFAPVLFQSECNPYLRALFTIISILAAIKLISFNKQMWKKIIKIWIPLIVFSLIFVGCVIGMLYAYPNQIGLSYWSIFLTFLTVLIIFLFNKILLQNTKYWQKYILLGMFLYIIVFITSAIMDIKGFANHDNAIIWIADKEKAIKINEGVHNVYSRVFVENNGYTIHTLGKYPAPQFDNDMISIATEYRYDKDVKILLYSKYSGTLIYNYEMQKRKTQKAYEKYYNRLVLKIKGISSSDIYFKSSDDNNTKIIININIFDGYDVEKIRATVNKLFECYEKREINTNIVPNLPASLFFTYRDRMDEPYKAKKYDEVLKLIKEAQNKLPKDDVGQDYLAASFECVNQKLYWTKKIEQNPNNAEYYVKRGDISKKSKQICYDAYEGDIDRINDYKKALEKNPKLYYLYEEIGDIILYYEYPSTKVEHSRLYEKLVYYYKALKYAENGNKLQLKIADVYEKLDDYEKALQIYEKIPNKMMITPVKRIPNGFGKENIWFYWGNQDVYSDMYRCYWILGQYDKARSVAIKRLETNSKKSDEDEIRQEIYNKIFYLDIKMKNYKLAKQDAKNCSRFVCKIIKKLP
ncbi:MAG: hypothetical protein K6A44_07765 [bacterium]|nr:hypothetical protein [bacterium]